MKEFAIFAGALLFSIAANAQKNKPDNVTVNDLQEKSYPQDAHAAAAVLFRDGKTYFDFDNAGNWIMVTDVTERVKIYTKDGYKEATVSIPYYVGPTNDDSEEVNFSEGVTYNLSGNKVEKIKTRKENEFTEETSKYRKVKKLAFPAVKEGSIIEYTYQLRSPFLKTIPAWYFQQDIPVKEVHYEVDIPQFFTYNRILSPYYPVKESQETNRVTRAWNNNSAKGAYGLKNSNLKNQAGNITYYEVQKQYQAENLPALKDEQYVDNAANYMSYVKHHLASTIFPNEPERKYASDWTSVAKSIYAREDFGKQLSEKGYFEKDIDAHIKGNTSRGDIITFIYDHVKNRMAFNGVPGYQTQEGVAEAYRKKTGNVADINLMLVSMLRYAGIQAQPVLLSTRDNGHVSFVNSEEFNYVIAGIESDYGVMLLDATDKYLSPGLLPVRALNGTGRLVRVDGFTEEIELSPVINSISNVNVMAAIGSNGVVTGQVRQQYYDYFAYLYASKASAATEEQKIIALEKMLNNAEISDYAYTEPTETGKPIAEGYNFKAANATELIGNNIYFSPMLFFKMDENPFGQATRNYPVDFGFPLQERYTLNIEIPDGYRVETMPESIQIGMPDNIVVYKFSIAIRGNRVQVVSQFDVNVARLSPDYYNALHVFYNDVFKKQNEKIVLKKG